MTQHRNENVGCQFKISTLKATTQKVTRFDRLLKTRSLKSSFFCKSIKIPILLELTEVQSNLRIVKSTRQVGLMQIAINREQEAFEKCWAHSPQRAASRQFTRCHHCIVARRLRIDVHNDNDDDDDDDNA